MEIAHTTHRFDWEFFFRRKMKEPLSFEVGQWGGGDDAGLCAIAHDEPGPQR